MKEKLEFHVWGCIRYAIIIAFLAWIWWFFRTYELFLMLLLTVFLLPFSVSMLLRHKDAFEVQVLLPTGGIGKEKEVPMTVRVKNSSSLLGFSAELEYRVRNVFTEYEETTRERFWAAPGFRDVLDKKLRSHHLGRVEVDITEFRVNDWLGICHLKTARTRKGWVVVGPVQSGAVEDDIASAVEDFPNENETKKRGTDINPDYEIREYIPGDDLKSIHWKLTAKTGRTMVRERLATGREMINVLLSLTKDATQNDELILSLHGLGLLLLDKGYPVRLCWLGQGNALRGKYIAEEGELAGALDEILSVSGMHEEGMAQNAMETEYPGEEYILVKNDGHKGAYIR